LIFVLNTEKFEIGLQCNKITLATVRISYIVIGVGAIKDCVELM